MTSVWLDLFEVTQSGGRDYLIYTARETKERDMIILAWEDATVADSSENEDDTIFQQSTAEPEYACAIIYSQQKDDLIDISKEIPITSNYSLWNI